MGHLHQLERYVDRYLATGMAQQDHALLKSAHLLLLRQLGGGITSAELVHTLGITKQGVSQLVHQLMQGGYIVSKPAPNDSRANRLYLSERGEAGLAIATTLLDQLRQRFRTQLGQADYESFAEQLAQVVAFIKK